MTKLTLDAATANSLRTIGQRVDLCDPEGKVIGRFYPVDAEAKGDIEIPFTDEEIERFAKEPGGRSLKEIMADLERLP